MKTALAATLLAAFTATTLALDASSYPVKPIRVIEGNSILPLFARVPAGDGLALIQRCRALR